MTGIQDVNAQTVVLEINEALSSKAFDSKTTINTKQGNDKAVMQLVADMKAGKVGALVMVGVNPMYTLPNAADFAEGLKKTKSIAFSMKQDETSLNCDYIAAAPHYLESWGDVEIKTGHFALMQPTIRPLFDTKQFQDVLLTWTDNTTAYNDYIKATWKESILNGASYNQALHDGVYVATTSIVEETTSTTDDAEQTDTPSGNAARALAASAKSSGMELAIAIVYKNWFR